MLASQFAVDANKVMASAPPADATTADKEQFEKDQEAKLAAGLDSLKDKSCVLVGVVDDVLPNDKFQDRFPNSTLIAAVVIELAPSAKIATEWARSTKELTAKWDRLIRNDPKNSQLKIDKLDALAALKAKNHFATLWVWIGGNEEDFKGWRKHQEKTIIVRVDRVGAQRTADNRIDIIKVNASVVLAEKPAQKN
jgi:hypothetical protein